MPRVVVRILHPEPRPTSGPLTRWVADARVGVAEDHRRGFLAAGADDVAIVAGPPDDRSFGARLRELLRTDRRVGQPAGLVVLGSGSIPLATVADRRAFVVAAADAGQTALANNRYSADVVAISRTDTLPEIPELPGDNALPRWLEEIAGYRVGDLRRRWRLAFDIDGPLDLVLLGDRSGLGDGSGTIPGRGPLPGPGPLPGRGPLPGPSTLPRPGPLPGRGAPFDTTVVGERVAAVRAVATDRRSELLVSGRTSAASLAWLEGHAAARVRAWVEERGLRAASGLAQVHGQTERGTRPPRAPASILGALLDRDGPGSLGEHLARFADAAIVDSRVLLAHRLGAEEAGWPVAEDRFASDVLLAERVADPWLRELTASAVDAPIPILLGGHTLVGPGVRLVVAGPGRHLRWT